MGEHKIKFDRGFQRQHLVRDVQNFLKLRCLLSISPTNSNRSFRLNFTGMIQNRMIQTLPGKWRCMLKIALVSLHLFEWNMRSGDGKTLYQRDFARLTVYRGLIGIPVDILHGSIGVFSNLPSLFINKFTHCGDVFSTSTVINSRKSNWSLLIGML